MASNWHHRSRYIYNNLKPTKAPRVYSTLDQAVLALQTGQIDAIVIDTPTGQYMASSQITKNKKTRSNPGWAISEHG